MPYTQSNQTLIRENSLENFNNFRRNRFTTSQIRLSVQSSKACEEKYWGNNSVCRFIQVFWFYAQRKNGVILLDNGFSKETDTSIKMVYKIPKEIVRSPDEDAKFFDIVTWRTIRILFKP